MKPDVIETFRKLVNEAKGQEAIKGAFDHLREMEAAELQADGSRVWDPNKSAEKDRVFMAVTEHVALCLDRIAKAAEGAEYQLSVLVDRELRR